MDITASLSWYLPSYMVVLKEEGVILIYIIETTVMFDSLVIIVFLFFQLMVWAIHNWT